MGLALAIAAGIVIVLLEFILWTLFRRKIVGLEFPREVDASVFHFFSGRRMRTLALIHTIILLVTVPFFIALLW